MESHSHQNKTITKNIEKKSDTIRLSNKTYIMEDHHSKSQKIKSNRSNLPEAYDKLKKFLEERRFGFDGKRIHNNIQNKNNIKDKKRTIRIIMIIQVIMIWIAS